MITLIKTILIFFLHMYAFLSFGSILCSILKIKTFSFFKVTISGFFIYFAFFEIIALPLILAKEPLSTLSVIWIIVCILCCVVATWFYHQQWFSVFKHFGKQSIHNINVWCVLLVVIIAGQLVMVVCNQNVTSDSAYYIGMVTTAVHTNTMKIFSPYTGQIEKVFEVRYIFSTYPMHNAVIAQLSGLHPLIQTRTIMSGIVILLVNGLYYLIGKKLFKGNIERAIFFTVAMLCIDLSMHSIYTNAAFLFYRTYEGKAIIGNVFMSMILYCVISLYQKPDDRLIWWDVFFVSASCISISSTGMFLVPFALAAGLFPLFLHLRSFGIFKKTVVVILPVCIYFMMCFLCSKGIVALPAI
ncbi:DUF6077 domain-containing protein [Eubacterium aggregans]|uniref:DUF6077 domain-containing protein n=1 Tax=Eubacterium aggregans TaxID=81409 RepID=UPI003F35F982